MLKKMLGSSSSEYTRPGFKHKIDVGWVDAGRVVTGGGSGCKVEMVEGVGGSIL